MTARTILDRAKAAGLSLRTDGNALVCSPASKATQELLAEIRAHKAELMALLVEPAPVYPTTLEPGERELVGEAGAWVTYSAELDRYCAYDGQGVLQGFRRSLVEARELALTVKPLPPPRVLRKPPPPLAHEGPTFKELRQPWPPHKRPRAVYAYANAKRWR